MRNPASLFTDGPRTCRRGLPPSCSTTRTLNWPGSTTHRICASKKPSSDGPSVKLHAPTFAGLERDASEALELLHRTRHARDHVLDVQLHDLVAARGRRCLSRRPTRSASRSGRTCCGAQAQIGQARTSCNSGRSRMGRAASKARRGTWTCTCPSRPGAGRSLVVVIDRHLADGARETSPAACPRGSRVPNSTSATALPPSVPGNHASSMRRRVLGQPRDAERPAVHQHHGDRFAGGDHVAAPGRAAGRAARALARDEASPLIAPVSPMTRTIASAAVRSADGSGDPVPIGDSPTIRRHSSTPARRSRRPPRR